MLGKRVIPCLLMLSAAAAAQGNQCLSVGGLGSALKVLKDATLEPPTAMTLECWIKGFGSTEHGRIVRKEVGKGYALSWSFQGDKVSGLYVCGGSPQVAVDDVSNLQLVGAWHHIAMTCVAGGLLRFYRDGELKSEVIGPACMDHSSDLYMGSDPSLTESFIGSIDEVRLWSVERTAEQIKASYKATFDQAPGLLAVWHLDGNGIDVVNGNDGVLIGAATFIPSDAPFAFDFQPHRGDWQGGTAVTLHGGFEGLSAPPTVLFGEVPSPGVQLVDSATIIAVSPPAPHPAVTVDLSVAAPGSTLSGVGDYLYTPALAATPQLSPGDHLEVSLQFDPPATAAIFLGGPLAATVDAAYAWQLECVPFLRTFMAQAPFQDELSFRMLLPADVEVQYASLIVQGVVIGSTAGGGTFTNGASVLIVPAN